MDRHPTMRVQFYLDGPFDPIETLSVTFLDAQYEAQESTTLGGQHPQYELWSLVAAMAAEHMSRYGAQHQLDLGDDEAPRAEAAGPSRVDG